MRLEKEKGRENETFFASAEFRRRLTGALSEFVRDRFARKTVFAP
jgi:hypothetical protein